MGNICEQELKFPDFPPISKHARKLMKVLLHREPKKRLGTEHGAQEIKKHEWFKPVNWALIRNQPPPIVPDLQSSTDTRYFANFSDQYDEIFSPAVEDTHLPLGQPEPKFIPE